MTVGLPTVGLVHKHHQFARSAFEATAKHFNRVGGGDVTRNARDPRHGGTRKTREPPEGWGWCYIDVVMFNLSDRKASQPGPILRSV